MTTPTGRPGWRFNARFLAGVAADTLTLLAADLATALTTALATDRSTRPR